MIDLLRTGASIAALVFCASSLAQTPVKTGDFRRVVTRLDESGKAVVMIDERAPVVATRSANGTADIWATTRSPAQISFAEDLGKTKLGISPPHNGTSFRVVDFAPTSAAVNRLPVDTVMKLVGNDAPKRGLPPKHPMMHRTRSVDYAVVISGEIELMMDEGAVTLKPGDVVVQQATNHAWINRGNDYARVVFVLVDADEP
jgi:mannose-6-phosphate isomerase-like protein (cupin superfamily)